MFWKGTFYLGIDMWMYFHSTLKVSSTYRKENPIALHHGIYTWMYIWWNLQVGAECPRSYRCIKIIFETNLKYGHLRRNLEPRWIMRIYISLYSAGILLIRTLGTNFSEIVSEIDTFAFKKVYLKMSSAKWRPFCLGLNMWIHWGQDKMAAILQTSFSNRFLE